MRKVFYRFFFDFGFDWGFVFLLVLALWPGAFFSPFAGPMRFKTDG